jgi:hypothetical protein
VNKIIFLTNSRENKQKIGATMQSPEGLEDTPFTHIPF